MVEIRDKWIGRGLNPKQFSEQDAEKIITGIYIHILKKKTPPIVICPSPYWSWYAVNVYKNIKNDSAVRSAVGSAVYSAVDSAVGSAVDSAVYSAVVS